jgi:hypothetical protein
MTQDNLIEFKPPEPQESFSDALSDLVRQGARQIIAQAVETELSEFLGQYQGLKDDNGRQAVVRNGYLPARTIATAIANNLSIDRHNRTGWRSTDQKNAIRDCFVIGRRIDNL